MVQQPDDDSVVQIDPRSSAEIEDVAASLPKGSPKVTAKIYFDDSVPGARAGAHQHVVDLYNALCEDTRRRDVPA